MTRCKTYCLAFAGFLSMPFNPCHAEPPKLDIGALSWMAGCWEGKEGNRQLEEHWTQPAGQSMLGMSRVLASGKTKERRMEENGMDFPMKRRKCR